MTRGCWGRANDMATTGSSLTRTITSFAAGLRLADIPVSIQAKAKLHILDSIGCGMAGAASDLARRVLDYLALEHREGPCPVLGGRLAFGPAAAAMANAAAMNALDFDDGFEIAGKGMGHPGATIVAAAASAPFLDDVTGAQFLAAVVAAYEINNRLIRSMQPSFERFRQVYGVGQHQSVGAAVAYGKLVGLDGDALENAVGFAATLANVPSLRRYNWQRRPLVSLKDFNAPAAEAGVRAVQLHASGLIGAKDVLDGEEGLWRMLGSDQFDAAGMLAGLGSQWSLPHNSFKSYPVCRWMHTACEAFAALLASRGLAAGDIDKVVVHTSLGMAQDFMLCAPPTMVDAQFSLPYALAAIACRVWPGAAWYEAGTMARDDLRVFERRVEAAVDPAIDAMMRGPLRRPAARVEVLACGGTLDSGLFEYPSGSAENPIAEVDVHAKFIANAGPVVGVKEAQDLLLRLTTMEGERSMRSLLAQCRVGRG
jgi:2-methylcitrate dehydratase PrpD